MPKFTTISPTHIEGKKEHAWERFRDGQYVAIGWMDVDLTGKTMDEIEEIIRQMVRTAGNSNRDLHERISLAQRSVIGLIRLLLPPHVDNEKAADYLRVNIGQDDSEIEWSAVRPDHLTNDHEISDFEVHPSPTRSAIFDAGSTSRINVGHFMADLITDDGIWNKWKGQMPVIYNKTSS